MKVAAKETLFRQGDPGDALFFLSSGLMEVSVVSEGGRKLVLDILRDGAVFGEIALFDPGPRTASIIALEDCRLVALKHSDIIAAVRTDPDTAIKIFQLAAQRMRWMNQQLGDQVFLPLSTRLARRLLYLDQDETGYLNLSQAQLADFVGATREAVSKTLKDWKNSGLIEAQRGGLRILDRKALSLVAAHPPY